MEGSDNELNSVIQKHTSLLRCGIYYDRKNFIVQALGGVSVGDLRACRRARPVEGACLSVSVRRFLLSIHPPKFKLKRKSSPVKQTRRFVGGAAKKTAKKRAAKRATEGAAKGANKGAT